MPTSPAVTAGDRGTLLVVDDNAINQVVARGLLARMGYSCDVAEDGVEALAAMGDALSRELGEALNPSFVTPFDREVPLRP